MFGMLVLEYLSTLMASAESSSTPAFFNPMSGLVVFGARPVANMTTSVLMVFPPESAKSMPPLPSSFKDSGVVDSCTLMPRDFKVFITFSRISVSKPFNGNG